VKEEAKKINEKTAEYLLYLFKSLEMHEETIDLCENYSSLVTGAHDKPRDIRNYYMSDCLLKMDTDKRYQLLRDAVFKEHTQGAAYVCSMTKAYMLDGNVDHGLKFFESEM